MRNVLALILMACLPSMQANAQTDGKYLFDGELPVFIDPTNGTRGIPS